MTLSLETLPQAPEWTESPIWAPKEVCFPGSQHAVVTPSFIPSPIQYFLSNYYIPGTALGTENQR